MTEQMRRQSEPGEPALKRVSAAMIASAAMLVVSAALVVPPASATPEDSLDCSAPVVDRSGLVDTELIRAAIDDLEVERLDGSAAVVVRVWDRVPDSDLVTAVDEVVAACWPNEQGGVADEVAVLGLSVEDRISDVLLGRSWTGVAGDPDELRTDVMGPFFDDTDYTGGLLAAIDTLAVGLEHLPAADVDPTTPEPDLTEGSDPVPRDADPTDQADERELTEGGIPLIPIGLGLAGLGCCGGAAYAVNRRRRLQRARRELARQMQPLADRHRMVAERDRSLTIEADAWRLVAAGQTRSALNAHLRRVEGGRSAAVQVSGILHQTLPNGVEEADHHQIDSARKRVGEWATALNEYASALELLAAFGAHVDHLRIAVPAKAELLSEEIEAVRALAARRSGEGWNVAVARSDLVDVQTVVTDTVEASTEHEIDILYLSEELEAAEALLFAVDHDLESMPDRAPSLTAWADQLEVAAEAELGRVDQLRTELATTARSHAAESWQWAGDHPELAADAIERSRSFRDGATASDLPDQRFEEAGKQLEQAGLELMEADDLLDELDDLLIDLERARNEAPQIIATTRSALGAFHDYVETHRADVSSEVASSVRLFDETIDALERELGRPRANHLQVAETGLTVTKQIDEVLGRAKEQYLAAEALRRQAAQAVSRARGALARAQRALGWQLFPSREKVRLEELEATLGRLPSDPAAAVTMANQIADEAGWLHEVIIADRRRSAVSVSFGPRASGGGSSRRSSRSASSRSRPSARSSGGRSFTGGRRSSAGRRLSRRRSTGRF